MGWFNKIFFYLLFLPLTLVVQTCDEVEMSRDVYAEGTPIDGIEIFFPLGFYSADAMSPKISPDGKLLLFTGPSGVEDWKGLWHFSFDTKVKFLLHPQGRDGDWSPDGQWIVFGIGPQIYKVRKDGTELTQLTFDGYNSCPDWSPAGDLIIYDNTSCGSVVDPPDENSCGVLMMTIDGGEKKVVVSSGPRLPKWYPAGDRFFTAGGETFDLSGQKILAFSLVHGFRGSDINMSNEKIVASNHEGIFVITGAAIKKILPNHLYNSKYRSRETLFTAQPSWYPDHSHIVYEHFEISKTKRIGSELRVEGKIQFYKVSVDSALMKSNL